MKYIISFYWVVCVCVALGSGCHAPKPFLNAITPDRIGYGISNSTMTGLGMGNKTMKNQVDPLELDFRGESEGSMVWLEWDFPSWQQPNDYTRHTRAKIRNLNYRISMMEAEDKNNQLVDKWLENRR